MSSAVAGYRSYTAIAEWIADAADTTVVALGIVADRRPSEAMIRRLLQTMDPQLLTAAISAWLASQATTGTSTGRRAIAVDGKTLRGSRTTDAAARHVLAACEQASIVVLARTDVDGKTNEVTRFQPLLNQISDLRDTVITADAQHCQREHVTYLAERGANWILTFRGNQPHLHQQLAALPWRGVLDATRDTDRSRGRREISSLEILSISTGIDFPHDLTTETIYAITDLRVHQARPTELAA